MQRNHCIKIELGTLTTRTSFSPLADAVISSTCLHKTATTFHETVAETAAVAASNEQRKLYHK